MSSSSSPLLQPLSRAAQMQSPSAYRNGGFDDSVGSSPPGALDSSWREDVVQAGQAERERDGPAAGRYSPPPPPEGLALIDEEAAGAGGPGTAGAGGGGDGALSFVEWLAQHKGLIAFGAGMAAVQGLIVLWAVVLPVERCTEELLVDCFPDWRSYFTLGLLLAALGFMAMGSPPDLTMLTTTLTLILLNVIDRPEAYQGFSDPGPITVGAMFVVAKALNNVGAVGKLASLLLGQTQHVQLAIMWVCLVVICLSAFVNNTPVVAAFVPLVQAWAVSIGVSPSKLLMPLSFASMLGGMCTLLGTSTNLIVASRYEEDFPDDAINLFSPAK
jgi:hypothetical protein